MDPKEEPIAEAEELRTDSDPEVGHHRDFDPAEEEAPRKDSASDSDHTPVAEEHQKDLPEELP